MTTMLNPYLSFNGSAREAMSFYESVFGGELTMSTFGDMPDMAGPESKDKIMHAQLTTEGGFTLMGADTPPGMEVTPGTNYSVSLSGEDEAEVRGYWDKLVSGGSVTYELAPAPWGDTFGMCTDKFGVPWMVNINGAGS